MADRGNLVMLLVFVALGGLALYFYFDSMPPSREGRLGKIDEGWTLLDLHGKEVRFGDFHGKVVFINLWGTYCPPCIQEMPSIQELYESMKDSVAFLIVSMQEPDVVRHFIESRRWEMPIYTAGSLPSALASEYIPTTFIANGKGEIVYRYDRAKDWNTAEARALLKKYQSN